MTLKELLKEKRITQEKLCRRMRKNDFCKYQQQVSEWIKGKRIPDLRSAYHLSLALECSADVVIKAVFETEKAAAAAKGEYLNDKLHS